MLIDYIKKKIGIGKVKFEVSDEDKNTIFEKTNTRIGLFANYMIIFLILLSVVIVGLESIDGFQSKYWYEIFIIDFFISIIFGIEYLYRWKNSSQKLQFPFSILNLLDLLSFLPFFILLIIYGIGPYSIFALFRIFRIFRIFELLEKIPIIKKIGIGINRHKTEYLTGIFVILILLIISSVLVYLFEQKWGDYNGFDSIPKTIWWAIVTLSTTGYGEMIPISTGGKIIASFLMIMGPILTAVLSTITVIIFINSTKMINLKIDDVNCKICNTKNEPDAKFCKGCGELIKKE